MKELVISLRPVSVREHEKEVNYQLQRINAKKAELRGHTEELEEMIAALPPDIATKVRSIVFITRKQCSDFQDIEKLTDKMDSAKTGLAMAKSEEEFNNRETVRYRLSQKSK